MAMEHQPFPTATGIIRACSVIDPAFLNSPLMEQAIANDRLGLRLFAKVETLNPIRSFKGRGADWWMSSLPDTGKPIVSASAGNFGQGLAYAGAKRGCKVVIFAASTANPLKLEAMRRLGAEVILEGADFDAAKLAARSYAEAEGLAFVEDGGDQAIAEGAGTIAKEITETLTDRGVALDAIIIPLGNGALLTGMGAWMRANAPLCRVIGVVASGAPSMKLSWERNALEATAHTKTIADGIAIREPVPYALESMRLLVDEVLGVDDDVIKSAMLFCRDHYGLVVEPAGAAGVAGVLDNLTLFAGKTVATVLCGGNTTLMV